jgi:cation:H+ antiporter
MARNKIDEDTKEKYLPMWKAALFTIGGIVAIVLGSNFVVDSASKLAAMMGVSEKMISLTIIALGTSLPELVTSVTATRKGECDLAIGNVVGSNILNVAVILGLTDVITTIAVLKSTVFIDIPFTLVVTILLLLLGLDGTVGRLDGIILTGISWTKNISLEEIKMIVNDICVLQNESMEKEIGFWK